MNPTRETGNWMPNIEYCINRVDPCGNAFCADEAMRAVEIGQSSPHGARQALKHALMIARGCFDLTCPLAEYTGIGNGEDAVYDFYDYYEPEL